MGRVEGSPLAGALIGVNGVIGDDLMCTAIRIPEGDCAGSASERAVCWAVLALLGVCGLPTTEDKVFLVLGEGGFRTSEVTIGTDNSSSSSALPLFTRANLSVMTVWRMIGPAPDPLPAISFLRLCPASVASK